MWCHVRELTVLWEQFGRSRCPVSLCLNDVVQITLVVIFGRAQIPHINALQCPQTARVAVLIDTSFASKGGQWVSVPTVWAIEDFIRQLGRVNA